MSDTLFVSRPPYDRTFQTKLVMEPRRPDSESYLIAFIKTLRSFALLRNATVRFTKCATPPQSFSSVNDSGLTLIPDTLTPKCKCGPLDLPVEPTRPITLPFATSSPSFTVKAERCI
jgi:hypothetical protein